MLFGSGNHLSHHILFVGESLELLTHLLREHLEDFPLIVEDKALANALNFSLELRGVLHEYDVTSAVFIEVVAADLVFIMDIQIKLSDISVSTRKSEKQFLKSHEVPGQDCAAYVHHIGVIKLVQECLV